MAICHSHSPVHCKSVAPKICIIRAYKISSKVSFDLRELQFLHLCLKMPFGSNAEFSFTGNKTRKSEHNTCMKERTEKGQASWELWHHPDWCNDVSQSEFRRSIDHIRPVQILEPSVLSRLDFRLFHILDFHLTHARFIWIPSEHKIIGSQPSIVRSAKTLEIATADRDQLATFGYSEQWLSFFGRPPPSRSL